MTRTHFINRVRCVCLITRAGKADEAVNSGAIDNESNCQHLQSSTRYETNPPGTDDLGALQRAVCYLALAKAPALASQGTHLRPCTASQIVLFALILFMK